MQHTTKKHTEARAQQRTPHTHGNTRIRVQSITDNTFTCQDRHSGTAGSPRDGVITNDNTHACPEHSHKILAAESTA